MAAIDLVLEQVKLPDKVKALRAYQVEEFERLSGSVSCGLYWDLGLGKTLMAILIGAYQIISGRHRQVMVLLPETLITQWCSVLTDMGLGHVAYRGSPKQRAEMELGKDFLLMSYQIFQKDYERLKKIKAYFIVDEATVFCGTSNLLYKLINGGTKEVKEKEILGKTGIAMTKKKHVTYERLNKGICLLAGIPVIKPEDYYGLIQTISPGVYESRAQFDRLHINGYDRFERPEEYTNLDLLKENAALNTSSKLMSDSGIVLPPLIVKVVKYDLAPEHLKLYKKLLHEKYLETKDGVIDALHVSRLYNWSQRIVLCPEVAEYKPDPVGFELLDVLLQRQKHFLIFCKYVDNNRKVMQRYKLGAIYGEITSKKVRDEYLSKFRSGELDGLTLHYRSGGYGLDLPEAKFVNFPELPVTPRDFLQCIGRAHRQGQKDSVVVTVMYAANTIQQTLFHKIQESCSDMENITKLSRSLERDFRQDVKTKEQLFRELRGDV